MDGSSLPFFTSLAIIALSSGQQTRTPTESRASYPWVLEVFHKEQATNRKYTDAVAFCKARNSKLAEITTKTLQTDLRNLLEEKYGGWIGGKYKSGQWKWENGTLIESTYTNWKNNTNDYQRLDGAGMCIELDANQQWTSLNCDEKRRFICQRDPCNPNLCNNGGTCSWKDGKPFYLCKCRPEFKGKICKQRNFTTIGGCQYHLNQYDSVSFQVAKARCSKIGTLAVLPSTMKENIISEIREIYPETRVSFWVGASKNVTGWKWYDNTFVKAVDEARGGSCLTIMQSDQSSGFTSAPCDSSNGYICEKPVDDYNPCRSKTCNGNGTCTAVGCQYKCNCNAGHKGKDCEIDRMTLSTTTNLNITKGDAVNIKINIETEDFPVDIDFCHGNNRYSKKMTKVYSKTSTQMVGPFDESTSPVVCTINVSASGKGYDRKIFVTISILAPAKITKISPDSIAIASGKIRVTCFAEGEPSPLISWYKDGQRLPWKPGNTVYQSSANPKDLYVGGAREEDAGFYTCHVNNTIVIENHQKEYSDEKAIFLRVSLSRVKRHEPQEDIFRSAEFKCSYRANPKPTIIWQFIRDSQTHNITTGRGSIFKITSKTNKTNVTPQEDSTLEISLADCLGPVEIKCVATNSYETDSSTFPLNRRVKLLNGRQYVFTKDKFTHDDATTYCSSFGGNLAEIRDEATQLFLAKHGKELHREMGAHIGGREYDEGGSRLWKWPNGDMFYNFSKYGSWGNTKSDFVDGNYVAWFEKKPVDDTEKKCLHLMKNDDRKWSNAKCNYSMAAICEKSSGLVLASFNATSDNCSDSIFVRWRPAERALGIWHKLEVKAFDDQTSAKVPDDIFVVANDAVHTQEFPNLSRATKYNVTVYVCPEFCLPECHSTREVETGPDIPGEVQLANVSLKENSSLCVLSWTKPKQVYGIESYKITVKSDLVRYAPDEKITSFKDFVQHTELMLQHEYSVRPNRNYTFSIQAATCAGTGIAVVAAGTCVTERGAPPSVGKPDVSSVAKDGSLDVKFPSLDETNGPISCLYIVVITNPELEESTNPNQFQERLKRASVLGKESSKTEYIALALSRNKLQESVNNAGEIEIKLGDGQVTSCDASHDPTVARRRRDVSDTAFSGRNDQLDETKPIGVIAVTATPVGNGEIRYRSSDMTTYKPVSISSYQWIVGVAIGIIVLICVTITLVFVKRRRDSSERGASVNHHTDVPMASIPIPNTEEPLYANLANENSSLRSNTDIPMERLESVYKTLKENNNRGFEEEYQTLKNGAKSIVFSKNAAARPSVKKKNRYKNILPFDSTRVKLSGDGSESYINASYVEGYNQPNKFIATQGPLASTVDDFWRMVAEEKCRIIVMLTKCFEKGKKKCEKYWPDHQETRQYGKITVQNLEEIIFGGYVKTKLRVSNDSGEQFKIIHFQGLKWPDHGVPNTTSSFFRINDAVSRCRKDTGSSAPIIVHCSAGAGRTGAFIAYDYLTDERINLKSVDVYNCILNMRKQRVDMVQNCDQYIFVHKLVLEDHLFGNTQMAANEVTAALSREDGKMSSEFGNLSVLKPIHAVLRGSHQGNMNRSPEILPFEHTKLVIVRMGLEVETPYINASYLETYDESYSLIAGQGPVEASVENFWRAAFDNDVTIVVALTKCMEGNKEQCTRYWPLEVGESLQFHNISVELRAQYVEGKIVVRELYISKNNEVKKIVQYHYKEWPESACPSDPRVVLAIVNKMHREINPNGKLTTLVHCSDGAGRTGAFCAIVNILARLKCENVVDVFREVKDLRDCRPGMVQTLDQYRFCYRAVEAFVEGSSVYTNLDVKNEEKLYENWQ